MVRWPLYVLAIGATLACSPRAPRTAVDYAERAAEIREEAPPGFTVVITPPFIVVGEGSGEAVQGDVTTVSWAVARLKADFFDRDPDDLISIWLFDGEDSYMHHANVVFGDVPSSPYGYYSPWDDALVINAASGRGTLVHEIVHPFVRAEWPGCPPWLDEGLASLFEQPEERSGHLRGRTNWRLTGLQIAIEVGRLPTFEELAAMGRGDFYGERSGLYYAQARYLLFYLQEKGLLVSYWRRLRVARAEDPTGYATLQAVLGEPDMVAFQRRWERFVAGLTFP